MLQSSDFNWLDVAKSLIIYISKDAKTSGLVEAIRKDLEPAHRHLMQKSVIVRVSRLPMDAMIEIEVVCDSAKVKPFEKNYIIDVEKQGFYDSAGTYMSYKIDGSRTNNFGEVFYVHGAISKEDILK